MVDGFDRLAVGEQFALCDVYRTTVALVVASRENLVEARDSGFGRSVHVDPSVVEDDRAGREQVDRVHGMADEHDRRASLLQRAHAIEASELEGEVADG